MALFALGDPHLSLGADKPMDVFGGVWEGYMDKLSAGFGVVGREDTVVLCGDISWGMSLEQAKPDFAWLNALPGRRKLLLKGNHDYWWTTASKMKTFFTENGFQTLDILHNNCHFYGDVALCGPRGRSDEEVQQGHDEKVVTREPIRLEASLKAAGDRPKLCFLHYPPLYQGYTCPEILALLERYRVARCYYGHLHGGSHRLAIEGEHNGVDYRLVAADYLRFVPKLVLP